MARPASPGAAEVTLDQQRQALADARLAAVQPSDKGLRAFEDVQTIQAICHVDLYAAMRLQERVRVSR